MKATVIIPLYKSRPWVPKLAETLRMHLPESAGIIWVSDGDGPYDGLPGRFIERRENRGFAAACNLGAQAAPPDHDICLLNADTWVTQGWLDLLMKALESDPKIAVAAPCILQPNGYINSLGSRWSESGGCWDHIGGGLHEHPDLHRGHLLERDMTTFACALIRRRIWDELGGLDESYAGGYWEDADFCMRVRERGYRIVVEPNARIYHVMNSAGTGFKAAWHRNRKQYHERWVKNGRQFKFIRVAPTLYILRLGSLGDVLLATSLIRRIKLVSPHERITVATWCQNVLRNNPDITGFHNMANPIPTDARLIDLNWGYERRPYLAVELAYAEAAGRPELNTEGLLALSRPKIYPTLENRLHAARQIPAGESWIAVHAGPANWPCKNWPVERWRSLIRRLRRSGYKILLLCPGDTLSDADIIFENVPDADPLEAAALIERCQCFVGIESFPAHLAQAMRVPAVVLYGPTRPQEYAHGRVIALHASRGQCYGCVRNKPRVTREVECDNMENGIAPCMAAIREEAVFNAVKSWPPRKRLSDEILFRQLYKQAVGRGAILAHEQFDELPEATRVNDMAVFPPAFLNYAIIVGDASDGELDAAWDALQLGGTLIRLSRNETGEMVCSLQPKEE